MDHGISSPKQPRLPSRPALLSFPPGVSAGPQQQTKVALWRSGRCGERRRLTPQGGDLHPAGKCLRGSGQNREQTGVGVTGFRLGAGTGAFSPSDATAGPSLVVRGEEPRARAGNTGSSCGPGRFHVPTGNETRELPLLSLLARALELQQEQAWRWGAHACDWRVVPLLQLEKAHRQQQPNNRQVNVSKH